MTSWLIALISPADQLTDQAAKAGGSQTTSKANNAENEENPVDNCKRTDRNQDATLQQKPIKQPVTGQTAGSPSPDDVAILKEELEKLNDKIAGEFGNLEENVRGLKLELAKSKQVDIRRDEVTFTLYLEGADVIYRDSTKELKSKDFYFRGEFEIRLIVNQHDALNNSGNLRHWNEFAKLSIHPQASPGSSVLVVVLRTEWNIWAFTWSPTA